MDGAGRPVTGLTARTQLQGRKSVGIYSEGFILSPRLVLLQDYYQRIVDQCRRATVALFVADPSGLRTGRPRAEDPTGGGRSA